jgi:hypothetical protein
VATTTQLAITVRAASPVALWHLLSLDAPTVAALWTWFIARCCHIGLPIASPVAMALAVWILYAADRLLDARLLDVARPAAANSDSGDLEARHLFHYRHRRRFLVGIALAASALALLLHTLDPAAIRLYLVEGALLIAWFVVLHATHSAHRLPKEIAVGLFFSAATFIPTIARSPALHPSLLPAAILFAALCSLNCLFIYAWEHDPPSKTTPRPAHATTRVAVAHLPALTVVLAMAATALALLGSPSAKPIAAACAVAAALLLALHRHHRRLERVDLRAAADLALLTPLLLLPFLR